MATKAELLVKMTELGIEGLAKDSTVRQLTKAIKTKEAELKAAASAEGEGEKDETSTEGVEKSATKHKTLTNVKHNGISYKKGQYAMLSPMDVELFRAKGFIETPEADDESDEDAQLEKAPGSDQGTDEDESEEGEDEQEGEGEGEEDAE